MTNTSGELTPQIETSGDIAHVHVDDHGHPLASADVTTGDAIVELRFAVSAGHLPCSVRHDLVEAVFALPDLMTHRPLQASLPLGDVELLQGLHQHCSHVATRAAGATCLIDAVIGADEIGDADND